MMCEYLWQAGEVAAMRRKCFSTKPQRTQPGLGFRQFNGIGIQAEQSSAGLEAGEHCLRVTTVTKRAVHRDLARLRREHFQNFRHQDGPVRAGGRFPRREHFFHGVGVTRRVVLLVFIREATGIFTGVTRTAAMRRRIGWRGVGHRLGNVPEADAGGERDCANISLRPPPPA